jgi:hypothetical protein
MSGNLPEGVRGRALAVGLALAAAALIWFGVAAPVLDWDAEQQSQLQRQAALRDRMRGLAASIPALRRDAEATRDDRSAEAALEGASDAVAAATLQQTLDDLAKTAGASIGSAETLPSEQAGAWQAITVRVTLTAPWTPLVRLLRSVAAAPTAMVVDNLQLRGPSRASRDPDRPIDAAFSVTAWRARESTP